MDDLRERINHMVTNCIESGDLNATWFVYLDRYINGNDWAICVSWQDYEDEGEYVPRAKVAYQPTNSMMQCDYDIDWIMPYNPENGGVWDTDVPIGRDDYTTIDWLLDQYNEMKKEWNGIDDGNI